MKTWKTLCTALLLSLWLSPSAWACASCFGKSDSKLAEGMNAGIMALLLVVLAVLTAIASFFVYLARRARATDLNTPELKATR